MFFKRGDVSKHVFRSKATVLKELLGQSHRVTAEWASFSVNPKNLSMKS